jgi:ABC-type amino acid transport substrate-binding protein
MNEKEDTVKHADVNNGKSPCVRSRAIDIWKYLLHGSIYVLVLLSLGAVSTVLGQTAPSNPAQQKGAVSPPVQAAAPWLGDFDGMLKRHYLRALVTSSKTQYYVVNGVQHGSSYEFLHEFKQWVNHKYPPKEKNLRFHVVFVPVSHDQILARLTGGRGDLAVGTLTITPERLKVVDFSDPLATEVKEIAVTGPHSPELHSVEDLSGQEVFVRKSSSYWEHVEALNTKLRSEGKAIVKLRAAPEDLEDED